MSNLEKMKICNIDKWHNAGYTGKRIKVLVLEVNTSLEGNTHARKVLTILKMVAPDVHYELWDTSDRDEALQYAIDNDFDLVNMSSSGLRSEMYKVAYEKGLFLVTSAGNRHGDNLTYAARQDEWFSVGAIDIDLERSRYSSVGEELDVATFGRFDYQDVRTGYEGRTFEIQGTSFASPFFVGQLALYLQWRKENGLPKLTNEQLKKFIFDNCLDLEDAGFDVETGFGLFILPEEVKKIDKQGFIHSILEGAKDGYRQYRILPSLTIAQAILESAWGTKHIANNLFGIKATSSWNGDTKEVWTTEYIDGEYVKVKAVFRAYDSFNDSVRDHNKLLGELDRYAKVRQANDYRTACLEVWKAGYATDPNYPYKLIDIIENYNLDSYDREVIEEMQEHWAEKHWKSVNDKGIVVHEKRFDEPITRGEMMALVDRLTDWIKENKEV